MKKATEAAVPHDDFIRDMRGHATRLDVLGDRANAAGDGKNLRRLRQWAQAAREETDIHERHGPGLDQVRRPGVNTAEDKSLWSGEPQRTGFLSPSPVPSSALPQVVSPSV